MQQLKSMRFFLNILYFCICVSLLAGCNSKPEQSNKPAQAAAEEGTGTATASPEEEEEKVIMFYGNSLTAGYGLDDPADAFPGLIQKKLDSLGYNYKVVNAGLSGETTSGGLRRIDWVLERQKVDIFVLELGANDGLRGQEQSQIKSNLEEMIDKVRKAYPEAKIILAGMMVPPSLGQTYSSNFQQIFPEVAEEKEVELIPFLLQDVAGERELNQGDGIHPTEEGQKILARNVWDVLEDVIEEQRQGS
jgi:acyl-CoA thioesterase-1